MKSGYQQYKVVTITRVVGVLLLPHNYIVNAGVFVVSPVRRCGDAEEARDILGSQPYLPVVRYSCADAGTNPCKEPKGGK